MLTGGDTVAVRFLHKEFFEFRPAFKLWLAANHTPRVRDDDETIWRRILRVPFINPITKERRDPKIKAHLRDATVAGPAVLAWMLRGCLDWQRAGLRVPQTVEEATKEYRESQDPLRGARLETGLAAGVRREVPRRSRLPRPGRLGQAGKPP